MKRVDFEIEDIVPFESKRGSQYGSSAYSFGIVGINADEAKRSSMNAFGIEYEAGRDLDLRVLLGRLTGLAPIHIGPGTAVS